MADESTTAEVETTETEETTDEVTSQANDPDAVGKALRSERAKAREAEKRAKAAEAKAKQYEDRDKSAQEKADERATEAEKRADAADRKLLRLEVASEKKLPAKLAARLSGDTREELEADADELLELVKEESSSSTSFDGGARRTATAPEDMNARIRAAVRH